MLSEDQVVHAMSIDDAYRVERVLAQSPAGVTERVFIDDAGPFVRKKMPLHAANRSVWAALAECDCPRLPRVAATYETPDCFAVVYDHIPGNSLEHVIASRGALSAAEAVRTLGEVCEAAASLHARGIVHGDISPANVVIAADGAHLVDLGNARMMGQGQGPEKQPFGTWGFASPEQHGFAAPDERSDGYALARLLGCMLTGRKPGDDAYQAALADEAAVPPALRAVVERGSSFEPSARYQTAADLAIAARQAADAGCFVGVGGAGAAAARAAEPGFRPPSPYVANGPTASAAAPASRKRRVGAVVATLAAVVVAVAALGAGLRLAEMVNPFVLDAWTDQPFASDGWTAGGEADGGGGALATVPHDPTASNTAEEPAGSQAERLSYVPVLVESGWSADSSGYIYYGMGLRNDSADKVVLYPFVTITGRDAKGGVLFVHEQAISSLAPGQTLYFGGLAGNGNVPATVEFAVIEPEDWALETWTGEGISFSVDNVSTVKDSLWGLSFTGEVSLESGSYADEGMGSIAVTAILRDAAGEIVYGETDFADRPTSARSVAFEVPCMGAPDYESVDIYVQPW